jgi:AcrR family transcriptional regulator
MMAKPKRGQGRPADTGVGREAIVAATRKLLQELPPARVTISSIAREAGVDPALVRYYFGDRSNLLLEVVDSMLANARFEGDEGEDTVASLRRHVGQILRFTHSARHMQRLMIDELAEAKSAEVRSRHREMNVQAIGFYEKLMADKDADFRSVDPMFLYLTLIGIFDFFVTAEPMIRNVVPEGTDMQALEKRFEAFVVDLVLNGLRNR